jgi:hypothetical protein
MKMEHSSQKKSPHYILGVPSYADARQIRAAYLKRIEMLGTYRFDKATQPMEWRVVVDVLQELNDAFAQLGAAKQNQRKPFKSYLLASPSVERQVTVA